ncbi:MAG: PQQ-dependent sugar dehydrogenase, partial [Rubripirellula sp.]
GLLYVAHGDGSVFATSNGTGQTTENALGKVLRINPIDPDGAGAASYSTPDNAFATDGNASTLAEVYSYGHRNPHNLTFARSAAGDSVLIAADIGQDNIDEVNIVVNGGNYGWSEREGTFAVNTGYGYGVQTTGNVNGNSASLLPENDDGKDYIYPALQLDHNDPMDNNLISIAGGPVINGEYFYGNFAGNSVAPGGQLYSVSLEELLTQKTSLDTGETVDQLTWLDDHNQFMLAFDHDNNASTAALNFNTFAELLGDVSYLGYTPSHPVTRSDFRFGVSPNGELLVSSKLNGAVFVVSSVVAVPETSSLAMVLFAAIGVAANRRRFQRVPESLRDKMS